MSVTVSHIDGNLAVCSEACPYLKKIKQERSHYWPFVGEIYWDQRISVTNEKYCWKRFLPMTS